MSNLGETGTTHWCSARADWRCAQGFTTGSAANGHTLASVTARFVDKAGSPGDVVVTLHAAADSNSHDGKRPDTDDDTILATLAGDNPDTAGDYTFTCSGDGCALAADTTYFARFSATGGADNKSRWKTVLNEFDETLVPANNGWTIANELDYRIGSAAWNSANDLVAYLQVSATVASTP